MSATTDDNERYRRRQEAAPQEPALIDRDDGSLNPTAPAAAADRDQSATTGDKLPAGDHDQDEEWPEVPPAFADATEDNGDWMGLPPSFNEAGYNAEEHLDDDQWHRADAVQAPGVPVAAPVDPPPPAEPREAPHPEYQSQPVTPPRTARGWRLAGLVLVAATVVGVLALGAYLLAEENATLKAEILNLQARLDGAVSPADALAGEELRRALMQRNESLGNELASLERDYTRLETELADTLATHKADNAALEQELLAARQQQATTANPTPPAATAGPPSGGANWFVNFGSYGQRALAQRWSERLEVASGTVILQEAVADGEPVYRVRIVGLETKSHADELARTLASEHQLPALWVGRD